MEDGDRMSETEWSEQPPQKAGYFWARLADEPLTIIVAIDNYGAMFDATYSRRMAIEEVSNWMGPLAEPDDP